MTRSCAMLLSGALGFALAAGCFAQPAIAQSTASPQPSPSAAAPQPSIELARSRIDAMLRAGHADPSWFSASFLAQITPAQVDAVLASLASALGAYQSVEFAQTKFLAHFAHGTDDVLIHLDADGKIDGLIFKPPVVGVGLDDALRVLAKRPGTVSYVIVEEGRSERAALGASAALAIGSAFKLAVLNAILDQVAARRRHWSDVIPLRARWKSLPSGVLRTWPDGTPLTLATYAAQMISISDNTAADALVRLAGQSALQPYAAGNEPFLTTREAFVLKSNEGKALRSAYLAAGTVPARAAVLRRVDAMPLPKIEKLETTPILGIEWHYSVRELCRLMRRVAGLPLMTINPGMATAGDFARAAFKGGSDIGIINLTTMVTTHRGTRICFSATENDAAKDVDEAAFEMSYAAALHQLAGL